MGKEQYLDRETMEGVLEKAFVLRLGLCAEGAPYVVPVCFAYHDGAIFIHSGPKGKKMEMLRANPRVCFEADVDTGLLEPSNPDDACSFGMRFASVIGFGTAHILEDREAKRAGLEILLAHYTEHHFRLPDAKVDATAVVRIDIESMTGKHAC